MQKQRITKLLFISSSTNAKKTPRPQGRSWKLTELKSAWTILTIHEWERKPIRDCRGIEFAVVNAYPDFPVFLGEDDDDGPFYWSYKTYSKKFVYFVFDLRRVVGVHPVMSLLDQPIVRERVDLV